MRVCQGVSGGKLSSLPLCVCVCVCVCVSVPARELERQQSKARRSLEEYEKWKAMPAREALASVSSITSSLQSTASASLPRERAVWLRVQVELPPSNPLSSLGPLGHVTVTCPSQVVSFLPHCFF